MVSTKIEGDARGECLTGWLASELTARRRLGVLRFEGREYLDGFEPLEPADAWLAPETADRVALFSWREAPDFGGLVSEECLPARYGGARACPRLDELCAARDAA